MQVWSPFKGLDFTSKIKLFFTCFIISLWPSAHLRETTTKLKFDPQNRSPWSQQITRAFDFMRTSRFQSWLNRTFLCRLWPPSPQLTPPNPHSSPCRLPEEIWLYPALLSVQFTGFTGLLSPFLLLFFRSLHPACLLRAGQLNTFTVVHPLRETGQTPFAEQLVQSPRHWQELVRTRRFTTLSFFSHAK